MVPPLSRADLLMSFFPLQDFYIFEPGIIAQLIACRASINFQTQEVPDFLPLKFGSPTGKSRKSRFFSVLRRSALSLVEHRFLFPCHTESS